MTEETRLSRRKFMQVGTTSLLALDGGTVKQIDPPDSAAGDVDFQGVADLLGPDSAKPAPDSEFFRDKAYFAYRYEATDTGKRYVITQNDDHWSQISMDNPQTQVDEVRTESFNSFLNHTFARPNAPDDKNWSYTDADVTKQDSEVELAGSTALIGKQRGNYPPGSEAIPGVAFRTTADPTAGECFAGYFADTDDDNVPDVGMGFGSDAQGDFLFLAKKGTLHRVYQSDWNGASIDERPFSKHYPRIARFPHLFYGGGAINWRLVAHTVENGTPTATLKTVHVETPESIAEKAGAPFDDGPPIEQPNLPPAFTSNGLTGANLRANACHYSLGDTHVENRVNGEHFAGISVTTAGWTPLISWQKRAGWDAVNVEPLTVLTAPRTNDVKLELQLGSTISSVTFGTPTNASGDETAVEVATGGTLDVVGERRWPGYATAGQANRSGDSEAKDLDFNLPVGETVTLAAQAVGGDATVYGVVAWEEYF